MGWLSALYAEQTTPEEVVTFLLLGTFLTLVVAFAIYALVIIVLWKWRMQGKHSLWSALFPSASMIRKYASEYVLGFLTAVLLGLTVSVRHSTVQAVLETDIRAVGAETVREALPSGDLPEQDLIAAGADPHTAHSIASWVEGAVSESIAIRAEDLVRPLLAAGLAENANLLVQAVVEHLGLPANSVALKRILLIAAVVLLLGYAIWFGWKRWREMQKEKAAEPGYATIMKRLGLPAVCIPLLLVSAVALEDSEGVVRSTLAAAGAEPIKEATPVSTVVLEQAANPVAPPNPPNIEPLNRRLQELQANLDAASRRLSRLEGAIGANGSRIDAADACCAGVSDRLTGTDRAAREANAQSARALDGVKGLSGSLRELETKLNGVAAAVGQSGSKLGLLLVQCAGQYTISGPTADKGARLGIHYLPPGRYTVTSGSLSRTVDIKAGEARTVILTRVVQ